jgi:hypothetical protein
MNRSVAQRGAVILLSILLLAFLTLMFAGHQVALAAAPGAQSARPQAALQEQLQELKYALLFKAMTEDNTPGTLPCPDLALSSSCAASVSGLSGELNTTAVALPGFSSARKPCLQYVVAPSLRNSLDTVWRGNDPAQKRINPAYVADLSLIDPASNASIAAWAVLLASYETSGSCSLDALGFQLSYSSSTGNARLQGSRASAINTTLLAIQRSDLLQTLLLQVLQTVDVATLKNYLASLGLASSTRLSNLRAAQPQLFDAALASPGVIAALGSCNVDTSSPHPHASAVSWLCFNAWHEHIIFNPLDASFSISDAQSGLQCTRQNGLSSCTRASS